LKEERKVHCSDEELLIINIESKIHIDKCSYCQERLLQLKRLQANAKTLAVYQPSEFAWSKVKASIPQQKKKKKYLFPISIAASVIVSITLTLLINSKWEDYSIDKLVAESNAYEEQFVSMRLPSALVGNSLWEISQIDIQLNLKQSKSAQKKLWEKRNETLKQVLAMSFDTEII
jgi:hypothetical protein